MVLNRRPGARSSAGGQSPIETKPAKPTATTQSPHSGDPFEGTRMVRNFLRNRPRAGTLPAAGHFRQVFTVLRIGWVDQIATRLSEASPDLQLYCI